MPTDNALASPPDERLDLHQHPAPGADADPACRQAYAEALAADEDLRRLLEAGVVVPPNKLRDAEDRALGTLLAYLRFLP
ncbi:MAG: hypothetical protein H3C62_01295 [Gemmatimonadaceae bacterium]|nr:hypothetical protein [Gemmatimonadaceae bacterium]